jgi:hypothetical protein
MQSRIADRCGTAQQVLGEKIMLQNIFKRSRHEPETDEALEYSTQRLMGRMENMLTGMETRDTLKSIRFATLDSTPSYYR